MLLPELEKAISELSPEELLHFRKWFEEFDAKFWDDEFERDVKSGVLDKFAKEAVQEYRSGKTKEL